MECNIVYAHRNDPAFIEPIFKELEIFINIIAEVFHRTSAFLTPIFRKFTISQRTSDYNVCTEFNPEWVKIAESNKKIHLRP
jgi:hypothetical protein